MSDTRTPLRILIGDCRETLKTLADNSVHCCVTSPPCWVLRDTGGKVIVLDGTGYCVVAETVEATVPSH